MTKTKIYTRFYLALCNLENYGFDFSYQEYPLFKNEYGEIGLQIMTQKGSSYNYICFVVVHGKKIIIDVKSEFRKISHHKMKSFFYQLKYVVQHQIICQNEIFGIIISEKINRYDLQLFIHNINYVIEYGWEPEINLIDKNQRRYFLVAYKDWIDFYDANHVQYQFRKIESIVDYVHFEDIVEIEGDSIDFSYPIEYQSIVVNGVLWMNGGKRLNRYWNELDHFKNIWKEEETTSVLDTIHKNNSK